MKFTIRNLIRVAQGVLAVALLSLTGCALGPDAHALKFHEEQHANLIVRYSTETTIFRLKPDARDGVFQRIYDRNAICAEVANQSGQRELAVVMIDYIRSHDSERALIESWADSFRSLHFQRVVFLRSRESDAVNGSRVVADLQLSQYAAQTFTEPKLVGF